MAAKGYIFLQEAVAVCLLCLLCTSVVLTSAYYLRIERKILSLQYCLQNAEAALAGTEISEVSVNKRLLGTQIQFLEVEVSDGENKLTLLKALTPEEAERIFATRAAF